MAYDGFMSYSHAADGLLAPALQRGLQRLAKPWYRARALRVFRDETALSTSPHLWPSIETALDESEWFVLLASPDAAGSEWVGRELDYWLATKAADRILVVVTGGTWRWDAATASLTGDAVPEALRDAFSDEPRHLDLGWARSETDLDLRNGGFRGACADLAAPMHGIAKDELESEDVRLHRRARRLARGAVATLAVLLVLAVAFGSYALVQRNRANHNALLADAGRLASDARRLAATHLDLALLLAVEARRFHDSVDSRGALEATLVASPELERLVPFGPTTSRVALSGNGRLVAIDHADGTIVLLDVRTGRTTGRTLHLGARVGPIALSHDGHTLATSDRHGTVILRDATTGAPRGQPFHAGAALTAIVFSPDTSRLAATAGLAGQPRALLWDLSAPGPRPETIPRRFVDFVALPAWSSDSRTLAIGDWEKVTLWDVVAHQELGTPIPVQSYGTFPAVAFSPDGRTVAVSAGAGAVRLWDVASGTLIGQGPAGLTERVTGLGFSPDGSTLVAGDSTRAVVAWRIEPGAPERLGAHLTGLTAAVEAVAFDGDRLVLLGARNLGVWHLSPTPPLGSIVADVGGASLSPDGTTLALARIASKIPMDRVTRWDLRRHRRLGRTLRFDKWPGQIGMAWSPDAKLWAFAGEDGNVRLVDAATGDLVGGPLPGQSDSPLRSVTFSPDGHLVAAAGDDGKVRLWDVATHRSVGAPLRLGNAIFPLAFSPDGRLLVTGDVAGRVVFFDAATHRALRAHRFSQPVFGGAFSPDGRTLAVGLYDGSVVLLDGATGRPTGSPLPGHGNWVFGVAFSRDGTTLATSSNDGTVILRDVATLQPIGEPLAAGLGVVFFPVFGGDGKILITGHYGGNLADSHVVLWDVGPDSWARRACALAGRNLTHAESAQYLPGRPYRQTCAQWPRDP